MGDQTNPDKPGDLLIEPGSTQTVKKAFDYYLNLTALLKLKRKNRTIKKPIVHYQKIEFNLKVA